MTGENSTANKKTFVTFVRGPIVYTKTAINNEATPAIAFAYLSAYIKNKGYDFTFVDGVAEGLNRVWPMETISSHVCQGLKFEEIIERIPANTDVIAFSAMFSGEWPAAKLLLMAIRKAFPDVTIVAGGEHVTALSEYCLKDCPAINVCVRGEGEHTFYELLECIENGQGFDEVNGVSFLDGQGNYVENTGQNRIREV
ncbi:MAG: radical SAM protein, partial [Rhodospirillales bacterium]|nr:radical SAM protein [Rhodospirillales bacterium]